MLVFIHDTSVKRFSFIIGDNNNDTCCYLEQIPLKASSNDQPGPG